MAYKCPKCQGDSVTVECSIALQLIEVDGRQYPELNDFDQITHAYWDDESVMQCDNHECDYVGTALEFETDDRAATQA